MSKIACITGDVHHDLGNTPWDSDEPEHALEYARLLDRKDAKGTVFVTGKCARRSAETIGEIAAMDCMEVGAHTYQAFKIAPTILPRGGYPVDYNGKTWNIDLRQGHHYLMWAIWGSFYGPLWYQKWNVGRTVRALREAGVEPTAWRTHGYDSGDITFEALDHHGFFAVSDVRADEFDVYRQTGDLWQATIVGPTDEMVSPDGDNEAYRRQFFEHVERASDRAEPVVFQMHPKRQAMMEYDHLAEAVDRLRAEGYEFMTLTEAVSELTGVPAPAGLR
ncbi:polysaccharide deacetylase family protein [Halorientalis litorea]|uniref:polysaccharide deacetylase family protein n=1 Tax=Halorientalis litorea TaxID=2931977 RepID=UPI001FF68F95|nr:polysaccharide deacetylase family protein [Halorientalis litorea]